MLRSCQRGGQPIRGQALALQRRWRNALAVEAVGPEWLIAEEWHNRRGNARARGSGSGAGATVMYRRGHQGKQPVVRSMAQKEDPIVLWAVVTIQGAPTGGHHNTPAALFHCIEYGLRERRRIAAHHAAEADINRLGPRPDKLPQRLARSPFRVIEEPIAAAL